MRTRACLIVLTVVATTAVGLAPADARPATPHSSVAGTPAAIHVLSRTQPSDRVVKYTVSTPSLQMSTTTPLRVDVVLPTGYRTHPHQRYPVLYALPGTSSIADTMIDEVKTVAMTRNLNLIVVAPDGTYNGDGGGFYTNWVDQGTSRGIANWETFHNSELVPWIDSRFRTVRSRTGRAIVGISQGGFGSMSYAARHPALYGAAASFSGAVDIFHNPTSRVGASALIATIMTGLNQVEPFAPFGNPATDAANWKAHDPGTLVSKLRHTKVDLFTSAGVPGTSDLGDPSMAAGAGLEAVLHQSNVCFKQAARAAGLKIGWHSWTVGLHTVPYMNRSMKAYLPILMKYFRSHGH